MDNVILNDPTNLESVKRWLQNMQERGTSKHFEILMDGKRIVYKTDALDEFDGYKKWLNELTQSMRVMVYNTKDSHRAQVFELRTEKYVEGQSNKLYATRQRALSEDEIERRVQLKFEEQRRNNRLTELGTENRELKKRLADVETYIGKLEKEQREKDHFDLNGIINTFLPALQAKNESAIQAAEPEDTVATYRKINTSVDTTEENLPADDKDKQALEIMRQAQSVGEERYNKLLDMLNFLNTHPDFIDTAHATFMQAAMQLKNV